MAMYYPCIKCWYRYNQQYTEECNLNCDYAKVVKDYKKVIEEKQALEDIINNKVCISKEEYNELIEYKYMYKDLCS